MKILYYNWVSFDDDENRGGGVTMYQRNLIQNLLDMPDRPEVYFISSGIAYSLFRSKTHIIRTKNIFGNRCKSFQIVNSPILSPGYFSFDDVRLYLRDKTLYAIFRTFIEKHGPFDVIHFNNFEGLSLNVLKIKEDFPDTKIVYSMHNYYAFCPQVNLWKRENANCLNFHGGSDCLTCLIAKSDKSEVLFADRLAYLLKRLNCNSKVWLFKKIFAHSGKIKKLFRLFAKLSNKSNKTHVIRFSAEDYREFRAQNVAYLNKYVDKILCVSERVREICVNFGLQPEKTVTDYIGTNVAQNQHRHCAADCNAEPFTLLYMGYMRRDKGFYFLLRALKKMKPALARDMRLVIAARITDTEAYAELQQLAKKFREIVIYNGYSHPDLPEMLNGSNLGVVPVLWEDNLPQVAIEMIAQGVPVLASDLGGAHELGNNPAFTFKNGDTKDFLAKLATIMENRSELAQFYQKSLPLTTFSEHIQRLLQFYTE